MNHDYSESFDEHSEISVEEVAKKFEALLKRKETPSFNEEYFELLSDYYIGKKNTEMALQACNYGLRLYPNSLDLSLDKTQLLINQMQLAEATELLDHVELFYPQDLEIRFLRGVIAIYEGETERALDLFSEILPYYDVKENIYFQMGIAQVDLGLFEEAIVSFQNAISLDENNEEFIEELINLFEIHNCDEGITYFKKLLDRNPYHLLAWYGLGLCYNHSLEFKEAKNAFEFVTAINEDFPTVWFPLGLALLNLDEFSEAKEAFNRSWVLQGDTSQLQLNLGKTCENLGEYSEAYKHYKKATELDAYLHEAWYAMAAILFEQEKYLEGIHFVKKAIHLDNFIAEYWLLLGDNESKLGNLISADEAYQKAAELNPSDPDIWLNWSLLFFDHQDYKKAFEIIIDGLDDLPEDADMYYRATVYLLYGGQYNTAYKYLQEALTLDYEGHIQLYDFFSNLDTLKTLQRIISQF